MISLIAVFIARDLYVVPDSPENIIVLHQIGGLVIVFSVIGSVRIPGKGIRPGCGLACISG